MVTVESLIAELEEARQIGIEIKAPGPMVAATMGKARLAGLDRVVEEKIKIDSDRTVTIIRAVRPAAQDED